MALTEKQLITGFLSKTLNMDEDGVASLYNEDGSIKDDALTSLLTLDVERVKKIKPNTDDIASQYHKKGTKEAMQKFEADLKEKFGTKSEKFGVELVNEIISEQVKKSGVDLNDDAVKKHPLFIATVDKLVKEKDEAIEAESAKLTQFQTELQEKETFNNVAKEAGIIFKGMKPILSSDPNRAKNQEELLNEKLKTYKYRKDGDKIIVLDKDGKVLEDEHGNRIPFEKVVKKTAESYYDFHITEPKSAPANGKQTPNGTSVKSTLEAPKTEQQFIETIANPKISVQERIAYESEHAAKFSTNPQN